MTLEMPYKDTEGSTQPAVGWSPGRAAAFGAAVLEPILRLAPHLRDEKAGQ